MNESISLELEFERYAIINSPKGKIIVGKINEFVQDSHGRICISFDIDPLLPTRIKEQIKKDATCIGIQSKVKSAIIIKKGE